MKRLIITVLAVFATLLATAQSNYLERQAHMNEKVFDICATIFTVALFMAFILLIIKRLLDSRLKNKIIEKGIPDNLAMSVLQPNNGENKNINIKWFALLAGIGAGLTVVYYTMPLGIHSLAIMSFSISISFLGYFYFLKKSGN